MPGTRKTGPSHTVYRPVKNRRQTVTALSHIKTKCPQKVNCSLQPNVNQSTPGMRETGPSHTMSIIPYGMSDKLSWVRLLGEPHETTRPSSRATCNKKSPKMTKQVNQNSRVTQTSCHIWRPVMLQLDAAEQQSEKSEKVQYRQQNSI